MAKNEHSTPINREQAFNIEHSTLNKSESLESPHFGGCEVSGMVSKFETTWVILRDDADGGVRACMRTPRCAREPVTGLCSSRLLEASGML
jgi:hypothetical protein